MDAKLLSKPVPVDTHELTEAKAGGVFTSIVSSPTANFLLVGSALRPGLSLLQNESYREDANVPLTVENFSVLDDTTNVYDLSWVGQTVLAASSDGTVRMWTVDASNRVKATQSFFHSTRKAASFVASPDTMYSDRRVLKVRLNPANNTKAYSLDLDQVALWDLSRTQEPTMIDKSIGNLCAMDVSPCYPFCLAIGTTDGSTVIMDSLSPSSSRQTFKSAESSRPLRSVAFNPFFPYWIATAGNDACVRVWDTRFNTRPMRKFSNHALTVTSIAWSTSHSEWLCSGSLDSSLRLWSLAAGQIANCDQGLTGGVRAISFSNKTPSLVAGLSADGHVSTMRLSSAFESGFASHKYSEQDASEYEVERAIYCREFGPAFQKVLELTQNISGPQQAQRAMSLLKLCTPLPSFRSAETDPLSADQNEPPEGQDHAAMFEADVAKYSYFIPGDLSFKTDTANEDAGRAIAMLQRKIMLREAMDKSLQKDVLLYLPLVLKDIESNLQSYDVQFLQEMYELVRSADYVKALKFAYDALELFRKQRLFEQCINFVYSVLFPTVFDGKAQQEPLPPNMPQAAMISLKFYSTYCAQSPPKFALTKRDKNMSHVTTSLTLPKPKSNRLEVPSTSLIVAEPSLQRVNSTELSAVIEKLRQELADPDVIMPMIQLMIELNARGEEASDPNDDDIIALVDLLRGKTHLNAAVNRIYFTALLRLNRFDEYYKEVDRLSREIGSFGFIRLLQNHARQDVQALVQSQFNPIFEGTPLSIENLAHFVLFSARLLSKIDSLAPDFTQFLQQALKLSGTQLTKSLETSKLSKEEITRRAKALFDQLTQLKKETRRTVIMPDLQLVLDRLTKFFRDK